MRATIIFLLIMVSSSCVKAQDSTERWKYGISADLSVGYKIKSSYEQDIHGTDLVRSINVLGKGGGIKFIAEYKEKWGFEFRVGMMGFDWSTKKFNEKMKDRMGDGYQGLSQYSLYVSNTSPHGLILVELNGAVHRVLFHEKKFNFQMDAGFQFTSWRNPEYTYLYRTPSTNYYAINQVTNKRSGLNPMINMGFSIRKEIEYYKGDENVSRTGYVGMRFGAVYGFGYSDHYTIISENHLNEVSEVRMDVPVNIFYFNLGISLAFM